MGFRSLLTSLTAATCLAASAADTFVNPIAEGADPCVVLHDGRYVWCQSGGNRGISLWISDRLTSLGTRHVIWKAPKSGPISREIWAPEILLLDGRWHIYFAASDGQNVNHLGYLLRSATSDPLSKYELHGPFATGDGDDGMSPNIWAIDMTVLEHGGKRFALWSGWDTPTSDRQFLYIAPMADPTKLSGSRVRICDNDTHVWERTQETPESRGLHEGPQILQHGGRTFLIYSCGASWLPTYKLGMLELVGDDPLDPASWKKYAEPVFRSNEQTFGVGHGCFVQSPDRKEWWNVFHAKREREAGWRRSIFVQPFEFDANGLPVFGSPVAARHPLALPSGETRPPAAAPGAPTVFDFRKGQPDNTSYFGHHQMMDFRKDGLHLGIGPEHPINDYHSGEKLLIDGGDFTDFKASTKLRYISGDRDVGLLFRVSDPSVGFDAQRGYFAAVHSGQKIALLGRMDGRSWKELARAPLDPFPEGDIDLAVEAKGEKIIVRVNGKTAIEASDGTYERGSVGVRVVDTHAVFRSLEVQ